MVRVTRLHKVKSSTLMETLVSMVLLLIVFGLGLMIYVQVTGSSFNNMKANAFSAVNHYGELAKAEHKYINESFKKEGYHIDKSIENYGEGLILLKLEAVRNDGKFLCEWKEVIHEEQ